MSKLIQALLNLDHPQRHAPFSQLPILDQEVFRIYQESAQAMRDNRSGFMQNYGVTEEKIRHQLQIRITTELDAMNLHRLNDYRRLQRVILDWNPDHTKDHFRECSAIKKSLIVCLEDTRKKQRLNRLCQEYKAHLTTVIKSELTNDFPNLARSRGFDLPEPTGLFKKPLRPGEKPSTLDQFLSTEAKSLPIARNSGLQKAIQKYEAVTTLQSTLLTHKPAATQIQDFSRILEQQKPLLESHRDSTAMRFLKKVTTALTFGIAAALGIFGVKGQQAAQDMKAVADQKPAIPSL